MTNQTTAFAEADARIKEILITITGLKQELKQLLLDQTQRNIEEVDPCSTCIRHKESRCDIDTFIKCQTQGYIHWKGDDFNIEKLYKDREIKNKNLTKSQKEYIEQIRKTYPKDGDWYKKYMLGTWKQDESK